MYTAIGKLILKAWSNHEAAEAQVGRALSPPKVIIMLREMMKKMKPMGKETPSTKANINTTRAASSGGASDTYAATQPQPHHPQSAEVDMRSTGSSPPMVSGPGAPMDPMASTMFGTGFDGMNQPMFSSALMPGDMDLGGLMDWSSMAPSSWGNGYMGGGGFDFSPSNIATFHGPGPGPGPR